MASDFALPDLGEGIDEADILKIYVHEGDVVTIDQPVMEIETDKATLDVPSGVAGAISTLHVAEGQTITPGTVLFTVTAEVGAPAADTPSLPRSSRAESRETSGRPPPETRSAQGARRSRART